MKGFRLLLLHLLLFGSHAQHRQQRRSTFESHGRAWGIPDEDPHTGSSSSSPYRRSPLNGTSVLALLFPTRQPRHAAEGALNLAKSVAAGLSLSVVSVLGLPIAGFRQAGWIGMVAGSVAGVLYGTLFAVLGVANGAYQMARGALETPRAMQAARQGLVWNGQTWKVYSFEEEQEELKEQQQQQGGPGAMVRDEYYYRVLQVATDATPGQIKRGYYQQARHVHPDKNPEADPEAFRELHHAYMVLSDPKKRADYDQWGKGAEANSNTNIPEMDAILFFAILFHTNAAVDPYIGDLSIASFTDTLLHAIRAQHQPEDCFRLLFTGNGNSLKQQQRQFDVAKHLQQRVLATDQFLNACRTDAAQIVSSGPFGVQFARAIGSALLMEGGQFERAWWTAAYVLLQNNMQGVSSTLSIVRESWDVFKLLAQLRPNEQQNDDMEALLPELLDVAWAYNEKDIRATLRGACMRLFADARNHKDRVQRAQAIQIMGHEFVRAAESYTGNTSKADEATKDALLVRAEVAYLIATQQSQGENSKTRNWKEAETMIQQRTRRRRKARRAGA